MSSARRRASRAFAASAIEIPAVRRWLRLTLSAWRLPAEQVDRAALIVTELATNAAAHTDSADLTVLAHVVPGAVTVSVLDHGGPANEPVAVKQADDDDERGRGLAIVAAVSDAWGSRSSGCGTCVWARLDLPARWWAVAESAATGVWWQAAVEQVGPAERVAHETAKELRGVLELQGHSPWAASMLAAVKVWATPGRAGRLPRPPDAVYRPVASEALQ